MKKLTHCILLFCLPSPRKPPDPLCLVLTVAASPVSLKRCVAPFGRLGLTKDNSIIWACPSPT